MSSKCVITFCPACACAIDPAIDARRRPRDRCRSMARSTRSIERDRRLSTRFDRRDRSTRRGSRAIDREPARRARAHIAAPTRADARRARADARRAARRTTRARWNHRRPRARCERAENDAGGRCGRDAGVARDARRRRASRGGVRIDATTRRWVVIVVFDVRASRVGRTEDGLGGGGATRARAAAARRADGGGEARDAARRSSGAARGVECSREAFLSVSRAFARRLTGFGDVVLARRRALGPIRRDAAVESPRRREIRRGDDRQRVVRASDGHRGAPSREVSSLSVARRVLLVSFQSSVRAGAPPGRGRRRAASLSRTHRWRARRAEVTRRGV